MTGSSVATEGDEASACHRLDDLREGQPCADFDG
jgi:hypothetical protein